MTPENFAALPEDAGGRSAWEALGRRLRSCRRCPLRSGAAEPVFGSGPSCGAVMLVGEAPGADEDRLGLPFVGRSGRHMTQLMAEAGLDREEIFITNAVKCRPPENRTPSRKETRACIDWLKAQISLLKPRLILTVGNVPTRTLLETQEGITALRGRFYRRQIEGLEVLIRPLFHPAYLLRNRSRDPGSPTALTLEDFAAVRRWMQNPGAPLEGP